MKTSSAATLIRKMEPAGVMMEGLPFKEAVAMLQRPYIVISERQHAKVAKIAQAAKCDVFSVDDLRFTFGTADGGYALMPLIPGY